MAGILKKVAQEFKKHAKKGTKLATLSATSLAKIYKAYDFKKAIKVISDTPVPKLDNKEAIIEYWQAMCRNYDKNYNKVFKKYYERNISNQINVRKTGVAALFVKDLHELFKMSQEDIEEIMKKLNAREQWLRNANPNGLKRDIDNTLKKLGISRPDVSKDKKITIGEYVASILDDQKVLKAIGELNTKLNWISSEINKLALDSPKKQAPQPPKAKFTHPNKPQPSLPLPDGPAPQPPKATASKKPQSARVPLPPVKPDPYFVNGPLSSKTNGVLPKNPNVLINSISDIFLSSRFDPKLTSEETREFNALKKYFKDNALTITNKIMNLKEAKNREEWVKYFTDKPFSKIMTYENFENSLYGKDGGLFQEMLKDGIRPNAPIPRNLPKGVKLPAQEQPSKPSTPPPNTPPQPVSQPKSAPQKAAESAATSNAKTTAIANATAAVTSANAAAETAKEAAEKVKQLAFDAKTNDDAKTYANLAQKSAEEAQEFAKKAQRFKTEIDQQEYTTDEDATHFAKKAQQNANEAQKASQKAKKFAKEAQEYAKKQVPPNAPPVSQTRPTSANTHIDANELKNKRNSLHRVETGTRSQASFENDVEKTFKNATNSDMFKRAQQQNQTQDEDDDDAWTD